LSRAEQGPKATPPPSVPVAETTRRVMETIARPDGVSVEILIPEDVFVLADPESMERTLINLLTNAYKYGGSHVRVEGQAQDGASRIVVADDGAGVPAELVPHLFEPFTRGPVTPGTGSGLGLAIARTLVESLGGEIGYEPGVPAGSRFVVRLPSERRS
jgi:signal transduction histidine kinase